MADIQQVVKIQLPGSGANPGLVGTSLGPTGVNMVEFCQQFNDRTKERGGETVPATITIFTDRSYEFTISEAPASEMIKKAAGVKKGSARSHDEKVGHLTVAQLQTIAEKKMPDLNANDIDAAMKIIAGSARSIGITTDLDDKSSAVEETTTKASVKEEVKEEVAVEETTTEEATKEGEE